MAVLGVPFRVLYEAKDFQPGLQGIYALVLTPSLETRGFFTLQELPGVLSGLYFLDFQTTITDPIGDYTFTIWSPQENDHRSTLKERFELGQLGPTYLPVTAIIKGRLSPENQSRGWMSDDFVHGMIAENRLAGHIDDGKIKGDLSSGDILGQIQDNNMTGDTNDDDFQLP